MIKEATNKVIGKTDLTEAEAESVMQEIMAGQATPSQIAAIMVALRMKGETVDEITGFARAMRRNAVKVTTAYDNLVDTCGTGGDGKGTFNISTATAFVAAGAGLRVAKHGNRSVSSQCGSADLLEAVGVKIELSPESVARCIDEAGIGFLFAPRFHPAMKYAAVPRRETGVRSIFNLLGPLTNPASARIQLIGVYNSDLTEVIATVLERLGTASAFVVHSSDGLDELSTTGANKVTRLQNHEIKTFTLSPDDTGIPRATPEQLKGGQAPENAALLKQLFSGHKSALCDAVLLNTAAILVAAGKTPDFKSGIALASEVIDSGAAMDRLNRLIHLSQKLS